VTEDDPFRSRRLELLRPHEIRAVLDQRSLVYLPLGTIEWHCEHLPVGLDALTAHGVCLRAAARTGGIVYPPLYYGTGGGHGRYPWTVMMEDDAAIAAQLQRTLTRLQDFGVQRAVLFSGHFADEQLALLATIEARWREVGDPMKVMATSVNRAEGADLGPDHAGVFETTLLHALWPDRVDISRLPPRNPHAEEDDGWGPGRHNPAHPLWGVVGPDPRAYDPASASVLLEAVVGWLSGLASN
jgi:creatinine amidohydrolase